MVAILLTVTIIADVFVFSGQVQKAFLGPDMSLHGWWRKLAG